MESDDAEIVRGAFESMAAGLEADAEERARLAERWWHPQIEYVEDTSWLGSSTYRGRDRVVQAFEGYQEVLGAAVTCRVRDGQLAYLRAYFDVDEARSEAGVSPS